MKKTMMTAFTMTMTMIMMGTQAQAQRLVAASELGGSHDVKDIGAQQIATNEIILPIDPVEPGETVLISSVVQCSGSVQFFRRQALGYYNGSRYGGSSIVWEYFGEGEYENSALENSGLHSQIRRHCQRTEFTNGIIRGSCDLVQVYSKEDSEFKVITRLVEESVTRVSCSQRGF